jgi:hypothetical protein
MVGKNLFLPEEMVDIISSIKGINCKLLSYTDDDRPMWTGFSKLLKKHLTDLPNKNTPGGYTKNHFFEFHDGILSIRDRVGSDVIYTHDYLGGKADRTSMVNEVLVELFGIGKSFHNAIFSDIKLPRAPTKTVTDEKIASIGTIMNLIPFEARDYYPKLTKEAELLMRKKKEDEPSLGSKPLTKPTKRPKAKPLIPTPAALHGRLQSNLTSSDRSSSNKKLFSAPVAKVDDIKVPAMKNFLMVGAVGRTKANIVVSNPNTSENSKVNNDLGINDSAEDNKGMLRNEIYIFVLNYYISNYSSKIHK